MVHIEFSVLLWSKALVLDLDQAVQLSFSNNPFLQALEVHKYEGIENALKIMD